MSNYRIVILDSQSMESSAHSVECIPTGNGLEQVKCILTKFYSQFDDHFEIEVHNIRSDSIDTAFLATFHVTSEPTHDEFLVGFIETE